MSLSMYDQVAIEKAKKRGRAYQCLACHFKTGERWIDEIGKLEDHILRMHIPKERIPFTCQLCMFKCMRRDQLLRHVSHYARHVTMAAGRNIINHEPWLCSSENPYVISELDYFKLSPEESLRFFLERSARSGRSSAVEGSLARLVNGTLENDISQETLQAGFIAIPSHLGTPQSRVDSVQTKRPSQETAASSTPVLPQTLTQPMTGALPMQSRPLTSLVQPHQVLPVPAMMSTATQAVPRTEMSTSGTTLPTFTSRAFTKSTAAEQPMPSQSLTGLFQPTAVLTTPLSDELVRGASIPILGVPGTRLDSTPSFSVLDRSYGSYVPSTPLMIGDIEPPAHSHSRMSTPVLTEQVHQNQQPLAESGAVSLPEQPIPVTQPEDRQGEVSLKIGQAEDPTDQAEIHSDIAENLMPQLLPTEDMSIASEEGKERRPKQKAEQGETEESQATKRRRLGGTEDEDTVRVSLVAVNSLVTAIQGLTGQMKRSEKSEEKVEKALVETTCALGKVADTLCRLKNVIEENGKEERRREERWLERERQREEERRKDMEAEQRRETRRREAEKKERDEIRRLLSKAIEQKEESRGEKKEGKENSRTLKSVLGKSYTENSVKDLSKRN